MRAFSQFHLSKSAVLAFGALAAVAAVPAAQAALPATFDAQIPFKFSSLTLVNPTGVAVTANGTVYIADPSVGVVQISPTTGTVGGTAEGAASIAATATLLTTGLTKPAAVAVDSNGNLYAADVTDHKVIELPAPVTTSTPITITYPGTETPTALAVDPNNNVYIADETQGAIYKVLSGATVGTKVTIGTLPAIGKTTPALKPVGLAADSAGDIYFANENSTRADNVVYEYTAATGTTAVFLAAPSAADWDFSGTNATYPIGMGFDPAGNLYVMDSGSGNLIQITPTPATNYQLPLSSAVTAEGLAVSSIGNLYISDNAGNTADEIFYNNNPFNFGAIPAGTNSPAVTVNFLFSTQINTPVIYQSMQGGTTTEFSSTDTTNYITDHCGDSNSCTLAFYVNYSSTMSGTQNGVVGLTDSNGDILAVANTGIDEASSLALYPGTQSILSQTAKTLYEPQGLALTGNGGTLFVADEGEVRTGDTIVYTHGAVWEYTVTGGVPGGTPTQVGTFTTPDALALDAHGNLYVADYGGTVTEEPVSYSKGNGNTWPNSVGLNSSVVSTGSVALNHPMALAFDPSGNLYIGDMGPGGVNATASNPGYIVKVPRDGGSAVKLSYTVGGVPIVFPDALAFDSYGNLYIADGGDGYTDLGGVDYVPAGTSTPGANSTPVAISFSSLSTPLNEPSGLGFDAANDLYVLDGFNLRVLVVPMTFPGGVPTPDTSDISLLGQNDSGLSTLVTPSNMLVWPGGQSISIADLGYQSQTGTSSPTEVYTLQAVNETGDASSGPVSFTGIDVGNEEIHFEAPGNTDPTSFTLSSCGLSGTTLAIGAATNCTPTVTYTGTATAGTVITLNGDAATDYSALGNTITVTGEINEPVASLAAPTVSFSATNTATLSNTGNLPLNITNIQVTGDATRAAGGTCPTTVGTLAANSTCTINFTINGIFSTGTVTVTDNSDNVAGSQQSASTFYLFSLGLVTGAGGTGGLTAADVPRNLLIQDLSQSTLTTSDASSQSTNKKGGKKSR